MFSKVFSHDAKFEVVTTVEAKKLVLQREDDLVGHKLLIYVIDKADKSKKPTRKVTINFFKKSLGFTDDEIIFADVNEFTKGEYDSIRTKFSDETEEAMKNFATLIFENAKHGLTKQVLNIAICENENDCNDAYRYFMRSNFEL